MHPNAQAVINKLNSRIAAMESYIKSGIEPDGTFMGDEMEGWTVDEMRRELDGFKVYRDAITADPSIIWDEEVVYAGQIL